MSSSIYDANQRGAVVVRERTVRVTEVLPFIRRKFVIQRYTPSASIAVSFPLRIFIRGSFR
jgi:hypothetical protein